jgi:hypothetical protein
VSSFADQYEVKDIGGVTSHAVKFSRDRDDEVLREVEHGRIRHRYKVLVLFCTSDVEQGQEVKVY